MLLICKSWVEKDQFAHLIPVICCFRCFWRAMLEACMKMKPSLERN